MITTDKCLDAQTFSPNIRDILIKAVDILVKGLLSSVRQGIRLNLNHLETVPPSKEVFFAKVMIIGKKQILPRPVGI